MNLNMIYDTDLMDLKLGDILYEFDYGCYFKSEVIELPVKDGNSIRWKSKNLKNGKIIDYMVNLEYLHYAPKLYNYMAYTGGEQY